MATYTLTFNPSSNANNNNWYGAGSTTIKKSIETWTVPSSERITKVRITGSVQGAQNATYTFTLISNTSEANAVSLGVHTKTNAGGSSQAFDITKNLTTAQGNAYSGKAIYLKLITNPAQASVWGIVTMTITTGNKYTAVVAGEKIYKTDLTQAASADDATYIKYRTKFSEGTVCSASTFNSQVLGF